MLYELGFGLHYPVTPEAVVFTDKPGKGQDSYTIPDVEGVEYRVDGKLVEPGTYRTRDDVVVTATAAEGWELVDGAETEWASAFTTGNPGKGGPPSHAGTPGGPRG